MLFRSDDAQLEQEFRDLAWIDTARPEAVRMSTRLERTVVTDNFAAAALEFVEHGAEAAQRRIGQNGGLND